MIEENTLWSINGELTRPEDMAYNHRRNTINMMVKKTYMEIVNAEFKPSPFAEDPEREREAFEKEKREIADADIKEIFKYTINRYPAIRRMAELNGLL